MAQCQTPFQLKERHKITGEIITVPCGKCPACVKRKQSAWSFRLMQEEKRADISHFITLTYDVKHVPLSERGLMTLVKEHFQLFMKRLRKLSTVNSYPIRYYAVGEYGKERLRPHYHAIIFNAEIRDIEKAWQLGSIHYGKVEGASVGYCLKYMLKANSKVGIWDNDDRQPEFALMSKGIGKKYLSDEVMQWHLADLPNRMYVTVADNKKCTMPRYYKDKIFKDENFENVEQMQQLKGIAIFHQKQRMENELIKLMKDNPQYTTEKAENDLNEWRKMLQSVEEGTKL